MKPVILTVLVVNEEFFCVSGCLKETPAKLVDVCAFQGVVAQKSKT
ncbi:MAG: hypothetical protein IJV35_10190 [Neisseriaceae bacterium]|nr:hypothetical protein [Neisseriaceae bacterium]